MTRLHVNVDHVATVRQARGEIYPDPVAAIPICEMAGADGITMHLREDRRHIQDRDLRLAREVVSTALNMEMAAVDEMVAIACELKPDICTLVPERREERTTEGGLAIADDLDRMTKIVSRLKEAGIRVSMFIAPDQREIEASQMVAADMVEFHTGYYCHARGRDRTTELKRIAASAKTAAVCGLEVAAGHGLHHHNVAPISAIEEVVELNIGHAIISRAVFAGLDAAVRQMITAMGQR